MSLTEWTTMVTLLGFFGASWLRPRCLGSSVLGVKNEHTKKSDWIQRQTERFSLWFVRATTLPLALAIPLSLSITSGWFFPLYVGVGAGLAGLYSFYLDRKWKLWQQLGYDGPPDLETQRQKLAQTQPTDL